MEISERPESASLNCVQKWIFGGTRKQYMVIGT